MMHGPHEGILGKQGDALLTCEHRITTSAREKGRNNSLGQPTKFRV